LKRTEFDKCISALVSENASPESWDLLRLP
jgi:hypothetical protein